MASSISNILNDKFRITGLASGLDTDSMVLQLLKADQMKIDKVIQNRKILEWKRDDYRSMTNVLRAFSDQYFDLAKPTSNFRSTSAFAVYKVTPGDASVVTAVVNASAASTTHKIAVKELASSAQISGTTSITDSIKGSNNFGDDASPEDYLLQGKQISVTLDGTTKTIDLADYSGIVDLKSKLDTALTDVFGSGKVQVEYTGDGITGYQLEFKTMLPGSTLSVAEASNNFVSTLGFANGGQNFVTGAAINTNFSGYTNGTFKLSLNGGTSQEIKITAASNIAELTTQIQNAIKAYPEFDGKIAVSNNGVDKLTFTSTNGQSVTLSSGNSTNVLAKLGFTSGATIGGTSLADINLTGNEKGKSFIVNINGSDTKVTIDQDDNDLASLASYIESKLTGVTVSKDASRNKLIFSSTDPAQPQNIVFKKGPEDSLTNLGFSSTDNKSNRISLNASLDSLKNIFDTNLNVTDPSANVSFVINGQTIDLKKDYAHATLNDVITAINTSSAGVELKYDSLKDKFDMTSKASGSAATISLTDSSAGILSSIGIFGVAQTGGKDAVFDLDGVTDMKRSSNTFTIDGVTYSLKGVSSDYSIPTTVGVEADVDGLFNKIKDFVDKYNEVVGKINGELSEKKYKDYAPLTDEQKSAMKDSDIALWESRAKSGSLRNDSILSSAALNMRTALYDKIYTTSGDESSKLTYNLASIGITTGFYQDKGKLIIDETKLKDAIKNSPDKVSNLFTQQSDISYIDAIEDPEKRKERYAESGLAQRLYDVLQDNIRTTRNKAGSKGILLEKAGMEGDVSDSLNLINKEITDADTKIYRLNEVLVSKQSYYYAKFARLEQILSQMNSQSGWLSSQLEK